MGGGILESDLEYLNEGFVGNIINKIKEMIRKFIDWVKNVFNSIKELFSKKSKDTKIEVEQVKKEVKKIEQDPNLDKNEKEIKKQKVVQKIVKHSKESTNNTKKKETVDIPSWSDEYEKNSQTKLLPAPLPKKYRYIRFVTNVNIREIGFRKYSEVFRYLEDAIEYEDNLEKVNKYAKKAFERMDDIKLDKSAEEYWKIIKDKYTVEEELTSNEVIEIVEENIKNFDHYKEVVNNMEKENNKFINRLKMIAGAINNDYKDIEMYSSLINKAITLSKQYTQINLQIVGLYANNLKPVEV